MKKPILNEVERMVILRGNSLYTDRLKLFLAVKNFEREFGKSWFMVKLIGFIDRY